MTERLLSLHQPAGEDLRNALQIAELGRDNYINPAEATVAFGDVARLLRHALAQLGEPNEAAIHAASVFVGDDHFPIAEWPQVARDCAAAVIHAQVSGGAVSPKEPQE